MYKIRFYSDEEGNEPLKEYIRELGEKKDKGSRINFNKIRDYINVLSEYGTRAGEPYVKHMVDDLWELRPLRNRIMFFICDGDEYILLSWFIKKTQKTPQREIDKAVKLMKDYKRRKRNENKNR